MTAPPPDGRSAGDAGREREELRELSVEEIEAQEIGGLPDRELLSALRPDSFAVMPNVDGPPLHDPGLTGLVTGDEVAQSSDGDPDQSGAAGDSPASEPPE